MCILRLGENGLKKYRLAKKWEQFKIVLLFMDHPVYAGARADIGFLRARGGRPVIDWCLNAIE